MNGIIYKATNLITGKIYIGQTIRKLKYRITEHKKLSSDVKNTKSNYLFYRAIRKYGISNFKWEILEECIRNELNEKEIHYIKKYNTYAPDKNSNGYNMTRGGDVYFGSSGKYHYLNQLSSSEKTNWMNKYRIGSNNPNYGNGKNLRGDNHFSKSMTKDEYDKWINSISGKNNYQNKMTNEELKNKCWINKLSDSEKEKWINNTLIGENNPFKKAYDKNPDKYRGKNNPLYGTTNKSAYKEYIITFPSGEVMRINGLRPFCRIFNLNPAAMSAVAGGFQKTHRNFGCRLAITDNDRQIPLYSEIHVDPKKV